MENVYLRTRDALKKTGLSEKIIVSTNRIQKKYNWNQMETETETCEKRDTELLILKKKKK